MSFKAQGQAEIAKRLREFADQVERGEVVVVDAIPSVMQEKGSPPEWLLTLRWKLKQ